MQYTAPAIYYIHGDKMYELNFINLSIFSDVVRTRRFNSLDYILRFVS